MTTQAVASFDEHVRGWRQLVETACLRSIMGGDFFSEHVLMVERFVRRLARGLGAHLDVVVAAAVLHDLAAIEDFSRVSEHHSLGAARAREILAGVSCVDVDAVAACIVRHTTPVRQGDGSADEVCLSNADALAQLANPAYWLHYAHKVRGLPFHAARDWYRSLVESRWDLLDESARELGRPLVARARGACQTDEDLAR